MRLWASALIFLMLAGCTSSPNDCDSQDADGAFPPATDADWASGSTQSIYVQPTTPDPARRTMEMADVTDGHLCAQAHWLIDNHGAPDHQPFYVHGDAATQFMDGLETAWEARDQPGPPAYGPVTVTFGSTMWQFSSGAAVV